MIVSIQKFNFIFIFPCFYLFFIENKLILNSHFNIINQSKLTNDFNIKYIRYFIKFVIYLNLFKLSLFT